MPLTKEQLETLLGSFHVDINATLAKNLPTVGTSRTVAALEKLLVLHGDDADLLVYHAVPTATTGTANNDLVAALTHVLTPVRESNTKLNKHCRLTLTGIPYAADIVEGRRPKFCDGHPVIDAYHLFAAAVKVIVQMASNPDFNVMTLVLGSAESDEAYTDYVWSILGSVFHHLVDDTLVCEGDPKATYRTVRETAMLDNQVLSLV